MEGFRAGRAFDLHARRPPVLDADACRHGVGDDGQLRVGQDGAKEGVDGAAAAARLPIDRVLHEADAGLAGAVEIGVVGNALLLQRLHEGAAHRGVLPEMRNLQGAAHAMIRLAEMIVSLLPDEMRQEVLVAPAGTAQRLVPGIVILRLPANIDHGVHGAAAAQHLGLRHDGRAPLELRLRHHLVHRQVGVAGEKLHVARRHRQDAADFARSRLDQQNPCVMLGDEAAGNDAAGASAADDDVVETLRGHGQPPGRSARLARRQPAQVRQRMALKALDRQTLGIEQMAGRRDRA